MIYYYYYYYYYYYHHHNNYMMMIMSPFFPKKEFSPLTTKDTCIKVNYIAFGSKRKKEETHICDYTSNKTLSFLEARLNRET